MFEFTKTIKPLVDLHIKPKKKKADTTQEELLPWRRINTEVCRSN